MILVTGGAGYIGSVAVSMLVKKGLSVRVYDKLLFGEEGLHSFIDEVDCIQGDIREIKEEHFEGVTDVIHLAGLSNDPMANFNPEKNKQINHLATKKVAELAKKSGVKKFVFASSCSIYDLGFHAQDFLRDEASEVDPRAAYAVSKYDAEKDLLSLKDDSFCPVVLRFGTVYGLSPRMRYDLVVNTFLKDALVHGKIKVDCGGEMWRPLVSVLDVARAFIYCLEASSEMVSGEVFNIIYKNYRILELAHWVKEALKNDCPIEIEVDYSHRQTRSYRASGKKIHDRLGFRPEISVLESVQELYQELKNQNPVDFFSPKFYNIQWLTLLTDFERKLKKMKTVL